ncbi:MAG: hypothetical protein JWO05_3454 [Gemmatimonadetes bacterium]|nr:hypothetical protein [Gemmatimonadota bacterium]
MRRILAALGAAACLLGVMLPCRAASAQLWNDPRTRDLVDSAVARRARQLADTGLVDYQATAHGYLTFLAQVGERFRLPPKILKADELALEVYWKAPNLSKQRIIGRRDTLLLPTDIAYHRDHLGIVQNNFPDIIRLGDGDEVADVPHPLSVIGRQLYDFHIADSLRIQLPGRAIEVYEVKVRPKNDRDARVVGALYVEQGSAQVVRMAFSFTHAAFLDKQLQELSIVLENGLVGARFWLPRRQEIEIKREGTFMDWPVTGIIRGRWEIGDYTLNRGYVAQGFGGDEIVAAPAAEQKAHVWESLRVLDSLPGDVKLATNDDVRAVQEEARALVRAKALERPQGARLSARNVSDFVQFNRAEGLSLGAGTLLRPGAGITLAVRGRYGLDDKRAKWESRLALQRARYELSVAGVSGLGEAGDEVERSRLINSFAAQEFGSDWSDPYRVERLELGATMPLYRGVWGVGLFAERGRPVAVRAVSATRSFGETLNGGNRSLLGAQAFLERQFDSGRWQWQESGRAMLANLDADVRMPGIDNIGSGSILHPMLRLSGSASGSRPFGDQSLVLRTTGTLVRAGADENGVPSYDLAYAGGATSAPGYEYHELSGTLLLTQRVEWQSSVPFPSFSLGRFGRSPSRVKVAPYAHVAVLGGSRLVRSGYSARESGAYPSVGMAVYSPFDFLRLDVARGLRGGRWMISLDVAREFWTLL